MGVFSLLIPVLGAFSNALRGGQFDRLLKFYVPHDAMNAAAFAAAVWALGGGFFAGSASFAAMWIGAAPAWGEYIGALLYDRRDPKETEWLDWPISKLKSNPRLWGFAGLTLRGLFWGACLSIGTLNPWFMLTGAAMGLAYLSAFWIFGAGRAWSRGEWIFGAVLWSALLMR